jgi:hypothetical protein
MTDKKALVDDAIERISVIVNHGVFISDDGAFNLEEGEEMEFIKKEIELLADKLMELK